MNPFPDGKILGREPTLYIAFVVTLVTFAGSLGFRLLSPEQAEFWNIAILAIAAAINAAVVRPITPAAFTYAIAVIVQLFASYGLDGVTPEQLGLLQSLVVPALALLTRGQVTPQETRVSSTTAAAAAPDVQTVPEG